MTTGRFEGRTALVTGGGTGIGYGCAQTLVAEGAKVTIAGRRDDVLRDAVARLGGSVTSVVCDITEEGEVEHAVDVAAAGGNLDVLVANAGSGMPGAIIQMGAEAWDFSLRLNVIGTALCIKHAALLMKDRGGGSIVAISSTAATKVQPWLASYAVSKAALDMLVRSAAVELAPHRIRVNSVQPGWVATDLKDPKTLEAMASTLQATPLGGPGSAADIGNVVAFLASDQAAWITGQTLGVDGGLNVPVLPAVAGIAARVYGQDLVDEIALPDLAAPGGVEPGELPSAQ